MKKTLAIGLLLTVSITTVQAASTNGKYEGYPVVKVQSNGQELKVEDVPAINFKDRTLVPIYLLRNLGAEVTWNGATNTVDVEIAKEENKVQDDREENEKVLLRETYEWLSDTDQEMWMFLITLQQYMELEQPKDYIQLVNADYNQIIKQHKESFDFAFRNNQTIKTSNNILDIIENQAKLLEQITSTKNLFLIWANSNMKSDINSDLQLSFLNTLRAAQQNVSKTNRFIHELIVGLGN